MSLVDAYRDIYLKLGCRPLVRPRCLIDTVFWK